MELKQGNKIILPPDPGSTSLRYSMTYEDVQEIHEQVSFIIQNNLCF